MILVDTSVWVDHFREGNPRLTELLNNQEVLIHPFVVGELSLGMLKNRTQILELLSRLPQAPIAEHEEVMAAVAKHSLFGVGIGWVDAHLVASSLIASVGLLTMDKALQSAAKVCGVIAS